MKIKIICYTLSLLLAYSVFGCDDNTERKKVPVNQSNVQLNKSLEPEYPSNTKKYSEYINPSNSQIQESPELNNRTHVIEKNDPTTDVNRKIDKDIPDVKDHRMIIKAGNITIEVDKYGDAEVKINEVITKYNGYIVNNKSNQSSISNKSGTFIVKVPAVKFDELISDVNKIGKVLNQNIQANDVTEEYVDLEARLKTQKELEKRIVKLLNEKVSKLADIFEIEEKLASVREKIEKTEGRMKLLKSQSSLSTLTLNVTEPPIIIIPIQSDDGFFFELKQAFKNGFSSFTKIISVCITIIIAVIPIALLALIVFWIWKKYIKNRKTKIEIDQ